MELNINKITEKDINIVKKYNAKFGEISKAIDLMENLKPKYECNDELFQKMSMILYAYKLGEMNGKRQERARKKVGIINE